MLLARASMPPWPAPGVPSSYPSMACRPRPRRRWLGSECGQAEEDLHARRQQPVATGPELPGVAGRAARGVGSGLLLGLTAASALTGGELHGCGRARRSLRKLTLPLPSTTHAHTSTQQNACTHSLGNMASCAELGKCNMAVNGED